MRKFSSSFMALLVVLCCVCFMACGGIEGTYKFSSMTIDGVTINAGEKYNGIIVDEDFVILKLEKNGTYELSGMGETETGVRGASDNGYAFVEEDGTKTSFAVNGNIITVLMDGGVIVLKK